MEGQVVDCRPMINKPPPLNGDYDRDPNIKALKGRGFINHGSTLLIRTCMAAIICKVQRAPHLQYY